MKIEFLEWDSQFFEMKIGKIILEEKSFSDLENALKFAKKEGFKLIYVFTKNDFFLPKTIQKKFSGKLVDEKVIYEIEVAESLQLIDNQVVSYQKNKNINQIYDLAFLQQGKFTAEKMQAFLTRSAQILAKI